MVKNNNMTTEATKTGNGTKIGISLVLFALATTGFFMFTEKGKLMFTKITDKLFKKTADENVNPNADKGSDLTPPVPVLPVNPKVEPNVNPNVNPSLPDTQLEPEKKITAVGSVANMVYASGKKIQNQKAKRILNRKW